MGFHFTKVPNNDKESGFGFIFTPYIRRLAFQHLTN